MTPTYIKFILLGLGFISSAMTSGCGAHRGGAAAYLSLPDRAFVTGSRDGGWSGPHQMTLKEGPIEQGVVIREGSGGVPHAIVREVGGEIWVRVGDSDFEWLHVPGEGKARMIEVIQKKGVVEVFGEPLREVLGLGGLGV